MYPSKTEEIRNILETNAPKLAKRLKLLRNSSNFKKTFDIEIEKESFEQDIGMLLETLK